MTFGKDLDKCEEDIAIRFFVIVTYIFVRDGQNVQVRVTFSDGHIFTLAIHAASRLIYATPPASLHFTLLQLARPRAPTSIN